jgi:hypothetical protein
MRSSIEGNKMTINQSLIGDIEDLCNSISMNASPELKETVKKMIKELKERKMFHQLLENNIQ